MLNRYYHKLDNKLLTTETEDQIVQIAINNPDEFVPYKSQRTGNLDNNWYLVRGPLRSVVQLQHLMQSCVLNCYPLIMRHFPNVEVPIHKDDPNARNCVLINPIVPKTDYVPTNFYTDFNESSKVESVDFSDGLPALVNTQALHNLYNNNNLRINLQLCFRESFETVQNLLIEDKLFSQKK
jgi:hypothetical protein